MRTDKSTITLLGTSVLAGGLIAELTVGHGSSLFFVVVIGSAVGIGAIFAIFIRYTVGRVEKGLSETKNKYDLEYKAIASLSIDDARLKAFDLLKNPNYYITEAPLSTDIPREIPTTLQEVFRNYGSVKSVLTDGCLDLNESGPSRHDRKYWKIGTESGWEVDIVVFPGRDEIFLIEEENSAILSPVFPSVFHWLIDKAGPGKQ